MTKEELKVLIVDDNVLARKYLKDALAVCGCSHFTEAPNGAIGVTKYQETNPDIVFLDIVMPELNGVEATKQIMEFDPDAFIIIVSSVGNEQNVTDAIKAGVKDFIQKPISPEAVEALIEKYLSNH